VMIGGGEAGEGRDGAAHSAILAFEHHRGR
jgi:hypothetical protein